VHSIGGHAAPSVSQPATLHVGADSTLVGGVGEPGGRPRPGARHLVLFEPGPEIRTRGLGGRSLGGEVSHRASAQRLIGRQRVDSAGAQRRLELREPDPQRVPGQDWLPRRDQAVQRQRLVGLER
jgi:hypothetical protein